MDNFGRVPRPQQPQRPRPAPQATPSPAPQPVSVRSPQNQNISPQPSAPPQQPQQFQPQPLVADTTGIKAKSVRKPRWKRNLWIIGTIIVVIAALIAGVVVWYNLQLSAVKPGDKTKQLVKIESGNTPTDIANTLQKAGLVRNADVFLWYTRMQNVQNKLQAGSYRLSPSESTPQIVDHLVNGSVDTFSITFLPGNTLAQNRKVLIDAGYSENEVDAALRASYTSPLFDGKPASADLEGYIYGETYAFNTDTSVEVVLEKTFEQYYSVISENNLAKKYSDKELTLYQGITLASIIQREASPSGSDMPQIAEVFYNRLAAGMPLGSDVTYQYIADKTGVPRDPNLDSPYNTRRYTGLPPGPIATPGEKALLAVANPTSGDYLYFLSGDDNTTYFARTNAEHEANIKNHCQTKCQIL
ncbi:hypothetical protein BGO18_03580 [Candidatus Saccharibacteria bacterium 47-87]|nr:endolytic transglycosylase MltG [Candidatus Saccharibacteria bacterium]OJU97222.1 MAG: hypothetical protein BGO18_03580 [Candidatus Saccharibacteria bacterium 47-87]